MRAMEKFTQEVGGYPFLYADTFMTRSEFEQMFDLTSKTIKNFPIFQTFFRIHDFFLQTTKRSVRSTLPMVPFHISMIKLNLKSMLSRSGKPTWIPCKTE